LRTVPNSETADPNSGTADLNLGTTDLNSEMVLRNGGEIAV